MVPKYFVSLAKLKQSLIQYWLPCSKPQNLNPWALFINGKERSKDHSHIKLSPTFNPASRYRHNIWAGLGKYYSCGWFDGVFFSEVAFETLLPCLFFFFFFFGFVVKVFEIISLHLNVHLFVCYLDKLHM